MRLFGLPIRVVGRMKVAGKVIAIERWTDCAGIPLCPVRPLSHQLAQSYTWQALRWWVTLYRVWPCAVLARSPHQVNTVHGYSAPPVADPASHGHCVTVFFLSSCVRVTSLSHFPQLTSSKQILYAGR